MIKLPKLGKDNKYRIGRKIVELVGAGNDGATWQEKTSKKIIKLFPRTNK